MLPEHEAPYATESVRRHARLSSQWLSIDETAHQEAEWRRAQAAEAAARERASNLPSPRSRRVSAIRSMDDADDMNSVVEVDMSVDSESDDGAMARNDRKKEFRIITFILTPAIITTFVFLGLYWDEEGDCRAPLRMWCLVEAIRLVASISLSWLLQRDVERSPRHLDNLDQVSRVMSMFSFSWFVMGHVWLVQGATSCTQTSPHLFHLTAALIILQYTLMLLPLIVLILLTPFLCLCLPCIIQGFFFFNKPQVKGATKREINKLPTEKFDEGDFAEKGYDSQCSICIADYEHNEIIRVLRCRHTFHKACIDPWLTLNGTCPICRAPIVQVAEAKDIDTSTTSTSLPRGHIELTERTVSVPVSPSSATSSSSSPSSSSFSSLMPSVRPASPLEQGAGESASGSVGGNEDSSLQTSIINPHVPPTSQDASSRSHRRRPSSEVRQGGYTIPGVASDHAVTLLDSMNTSESNNVALPPVAPHGGNSGEHALHARETWSPRSRPRGALLRNSASAESLVVRGRDNRPSHNRLRRARAESASGPGGLLMGNRSFSLHSTLVRSWGLASRARAVERRRLGSDGLHFADGTLGARATDDEDDEGMLNSIGWALGLGNNGPGDEREDRSEARSSWESASTGLVSAQRGATAVDPVDSDLHDSV